MFIYTDVTDNIQAQNGSNCRDKACRAGHTSCGSRRCDNGVLDNGADLVDASELAQMIDRPLSFDQGDHYNASLHALAKVASQAAAGDVRVATTEDALFLLRKNLGKLGFDSETCDMVQDTILEMVEQSNGQRVPLAVTKAVLRELLCELSEEDNYRLLAQNVSTGTYAKSRSNTEDLGQFASMWEVARTTGERVVLVTSDQGFVETGRILAKYTRGVYVVTPETYLNEAKFIQEINGIDMLATRTAVTG